MPTTKLTSSAALRDVRECLIRMRVRRTTIDVDPVTLAALGFPLPALAGIGVDVLHLNVLIAAYPRFAADTASPPEHPRRLWVPTYSAKSFGGRLVIWKGYAYGRIMWITC